MNWKFLLCLLFGYGLMSLPGTRVASAQNKTSAPVRLMAAAAKSNITPPVEVKNWVTGKPYTGIRDSIYTRALVISDGDQKAVIIHWELVDAGESATALVRERISSVLGIPETNILVNAAHNHSAPWSPVYGQDNRRGKELEPWWVIRYMPRQNEDPYFKSWMNKLIDNTVRAAVGAAQNLRPASMWIGRYDASEYLHNRRPRPVTRGIEKSGLPDGFNYKHEDWDPNVLGGEQTFGPLDRTLTAISFRDARGSNISTLFHLSCHAVSIYPFSDELSGDWSGNTIRVLNRELGGENIFLQGTAGDINPWMRGAEAVEEMASGLSENIKTAYRYSAKLETASLNIGTKEVALPLNDTGKERTGLETVSAEIQAITIGSLALVTLPGEPMTELGMAIREASPYPHTLVLGYSNGNGVHYVGMPGEEARGGYEIEAGTVGTDQAGLPLVEAASRLLRALPDTVE